MLSIAIDGPVGAGKSTVADEVARRLGILHLDTGAMYRAVGLAVVAAGIDVQDEAAVTALCEQGGARVDVRYENGAQVTLVNGRDVTGSIRSQEAGTAASAVSRYAAVRRMLVRRQQELAREQPMLLDGRDIGTVVLKDATVKIYLTASPEARARRRLNQLREKGQDADFGEILHEVNTRDHQDMTRAVDPLRQAEDAIVVDSSDLNFEETVQANRHGRDMSAGFENGWVELLDLNKMLAADGTAERAERAVENLKRKRLKVFSGNYIGVNPRNAGDTIDLTAGYEENQNSSIPSFGYILKDCITVEN